MRRLSTPALAPPLLSDRALLARAEQRRSRPCAPSWEAPGAPAHAVSRGLLRESGVKKTIHAPHFRGHASRHRRCHAQRLVTAHEVVVGKVQRSRRAVIAKLL